MIPIKKYIKLGLSFCFISFLLFFFSFLNLSADEIKWVEVANTSNKIQLIDLRNIKTNFFLNKFSNGLC